jgi:galactokinase
MLAITENDSWSNLLKETGISIHNYLTTLPMKKGLSSSAAVCVLVVQCFSDFFQLNLETQQVMELAYLGEMNTPSRSDLLCLAGELTLLSLGW